MYGDDSHSDIKKYVTDDELEFSWGFPFQGSLEMKVRINKGTFKSEAKVGVEISSLSGYPFDVYGKDEFQNEFVMKDLEKTTICIEGAYEKDCFIQAILKLSLFLKLAGYKLESENYDQE